MKECCLTKVQYLSVFLAFLLLNTPIYAQSGNANSDINEKVIKKAKKYRKDISNEVLKTIKKWDCPAILHGNYIENQNGHSLTLEGKVMEFGEAYIGLKPIWYQFYEITSPSGKKGIASYSANHVGKMYVPFKYDYLINHGHEGYFAGEYEEDGEKYLDVISLWGKVLVRIKNPKNFRCKYYKKYNQYLISSEKPDDPSRRRFYILYPDGDKVAGRITAEKIVLRGNHILVTDSGKTKRYKDSKYGTVEHQGSGLSDPSRNEELAFDYFFSNKWIAQALHYFSDKKDYKSALECFNYFEQFDASIVDYHDTYAGYMYVRLRVLSYSNAGLYADLQRYVRGKDPQYKPSTFGLYYDSETDAFVDTSDRIIDIDGRREESVECLNLCNNVYAKSYERLKEQERENAQMAAAIVGAVTTTISTIFSDSQSSSNNSTKGKNTKSASKSSSSSSSSTANQESGKADRRKCPRCNGTGRLEVEHSVNGSLNKKMRTCSECGKTYDSASIGHHHEVCGQCKGDGEL